ncbi:mechanosensitive ion channel [Candidatus Woesearchaeota archaeon]|nr:mechanosensitive ion channel [Candidatus Woesearchaeota archaeon]
MPEPTETLLTTTDKLHYISEIIKPVFTKIITAVVVLLIGLIIGKIIGNVLQKVLYELELNKLIKKITGLRIRFEEFIGTLVTYGIFFISIIFALDILELTTIIVQTLGMLILFIILISVVLSVKDFIPNLISGLIIAKKKLIQENDLIELGSVKGKVLQVELLETKVMTPNDDILYIPNSMITNQKIRRMRRKKHVSSN